MHDIKLITQWNVDWGERFPIRLTKSQKNQFLQTVENELHQRHFITERVAVRKVFAGVNLVTKCEAPRVIFLAHYDTPTIIPFWFSWLFRLIGHTRQMVAMVLLIGLLLIPSLLPVPAGFVTLFHLVLVLTFLALLIPNPHNREDNTSGVIGLMALAEWLKTRPEIQKQVQLVFVDNEEWGLLGSAGLKKVWDAQRHPYRQAAIINLDCISRGQVPLLVYHRVGTLAQKLRPYLHKHLPAIRIIDMKIVALSDNFTFRREGAVDISFADPTLIPGGYYISKIHTPADNDFSPERLLLLIQGLTEFLEEEITGTS